jgi:hypothetical protein
VNRDEPLSTRRRVVILGAQAFALGLVVAWVSIPANAIFLESYGSGALPWTYVAAAVAGGLATFGLTAAFRKRTLVWVTIRVLVAFAATLVGSFVALRSSGPWVSVILLILIPILIPVGFIFVVGQAGMLLDVRVLKALYGRVIAGFAAGLLTGGLAGPLVLAVFGRADSLVALAAVVTVCFALLVRYAQRCFPELSAPPEEEHEDAGRPTLRSLTRNPFVVLLALFQVLSATESQWLDYLVYDRASQRYDSSEALAGFISRFTAISYGAEIVFLLCCSGWVLRRFGLRAGLALDAVVGLMIVGSTIVFGAAIGAGATIVFVLIVAARVSDLTLGDGAARTSLSAAYQAVPTRERLAAQAAIEGLAVPVAIGVSGIVLILVRQTVGTGGLILPVLTSVVLVAWLVVAVLAFRSYRVNLLANLRHRMLDPAELTVDDVNTLAAIDRLIDSDNEREIRLGVHALTVAGHPMLPARLERLTADDRVGVRSFALDCLLEVDPAAAARSARGGLDHPDAGIRAASVRALGTGADPADVAMMLAFWDDHHHDVRVAAAAALARLGDADVLRQFSLDVHDLSRSDDPRERVLAAEVLSVCGPTTGMSSGVLAVLLRDTDLDVARAALDAVRWPDDDALLDDVVAHLDNRHTSAAAVEALAGGGPAVLEVVDRGLSEDSRFTRFGQQQLARVGRMMGGDDAIVVLCRHLGHRDRDVGLAIARALAVLSAGHVPDRAGATRDLASVLLAETATETIRRDLNDAARALRVLCMFADSPQHAMLCRALLDLLGLLEQRVVACLAMRYGDENVGKVRYQFAQNDARSHALAIEWMDVTFVGTDRVATALIEPDLTAPERLRLLERAFPLPPSEPSDLLRDLVEDPHRRWRPWIAACALLGILSNGEADPESFAVEPALPATESSWAEEAAVVHETLTGIRHRLQV